MSDGHGRKLSALDRLAIPTILSAAGLALAAVTMNVQAISVRRQMSDKAAAAHCHKADEQGCESLKADVRAASAAEDAIDFGAWQTIFNIFGLAGLGATVIYARRAWVASERAHITTQRPWIVLSEYRLTEPVIVGPALIRIQGEMVFKNIGPSVGRHVTANSGLIYNLQDVEALRRRMRDDGLAALGGGGGHVVAPGETYCEFGFGGNFTERDIAAATNPRQGITLLFHVGVYYHSPNDDLPHYTEYTLLVQRKNPGRSILDRPYIHTTDGVIPLDQLEVVRFGGERAA